MNVKVNELDQFNDYRLESIGYLVTCRYNRLQTNNTLHIVEM